MSDPTKIGQRVQYTSIAGISQVRRLPRLGKIRLGVKGTTAGGKEYPKDVDYFVCTTSPEVEKVYGQKPRELDVMIPVEDQSMFFPYALKWYSTSQLICKGNGVEANRLVGKVDEDDVLIEEAEPGGMTCVVKCPCSHLKKDDNPKGECTTKATLMVMLPTVSMGGIYAIDTGSHNNIIEINSALDMIRFLCGRVALIPLKLRRVERSLIRPGEAKKTTKWLLQLVLDQNMAAVQAYRDGAVLALDRAKYLALPAPDRDITDDGPIEGVIDSELQVGKSAEPGTAPTEHKTNGLSDAPAQGVAPPPTQPASQPPSPSTEEPPEREPGQDEGEADMTATERITNVLNSTRTMTDLDIAWRVQVVQNKVLTREEKLSLQEVLLERKNYLKKNARSA
jgi:hypothetical protein